MEPWWDAGGKLEPAHVLSLWGVYLHRFSGPDSG
jgi:hypothetical protein